MAFTERQITLTGWGETGNPNRISYPSTYTHPAEGTAGTVAFSDGTTTKVFYNADGYTQLGTIGTDTLYRHYGNKHFESTYVAGYLTGGGHSDFGFWTATYTQSYNSNTGGSTTDSQVIDIPGQSGTYSVEAVLLWNNGTGNENGGRFMFAVTPDDEVEIGNAVWDDYWFVVYNSTQTVAFDGDLLTSTGNNSYERWQSPLLAQDDWNTAKSIMANGQTFHLKIQQKAV